MDGESGAFKATVPELPGVSASAETMEMLENYIIDEIALSIGGRNPHNFFIDTYNEPANIAMDVFRGIISNRLMNLCGCEMEFCIKDSKGHNYCFFEFRSTKMSAVIMSTAAVSA